MQQDQKHSTSDPAYYNPNNPSPNDAPPDPSNTSNIGQKIEQGVIDKREGISEQSSKWEDSQESTANSIIPAEAEKYIKDPSPEEVNHEEREDEADKLMGAAQ